MTDENVLEVEFLCNNCHYGFTKRYPHEVMVFDRLNDADTVESIEKSLTQAGNAHTTKVTCPACHVTWISVAQRISLKQIQEFQEKWEQTNVRDAAEEWNEMSIFGKLRYGFCYEKFLDRW